MISDMSYIYIYIYITLTPQIKVNHGDIYQIYPVVMATGRDIFLIYHIVMATNYYALVFTLKHSALYSIFGQCLGSDLVSTYIITQMYL